MIEITAKLIRGPVYFTSEHLKCYVTFKNVTSDASIQHQQQHHQQQQTGQDASSDNNETLNGHPVNKRTSPSASSSLVARNEMMAWAGVQIYCHCSLDDTKVRFMKDEGDSSSSASDSFSSSDTSFNPCKNEKGHVVFSTQTKILFCMLSLAPNESKTFIYSEQIPSHAPPSYYGSAVKYLYKLTIGTQRVKEGIQLLKIPLRILQITPEIQKGLDLCLTSKINQIDLDEREDDRKGDKEKQQQQEEVSEEDMLNLVIDQLDSLTARKNSNSYVITNQSGQVAKFCLLKSSFKLGEDVIGIFNFSEATVPCVQFSVILQSEEVISNECKINSGTTRSGSSSSSSTGVLRTNHSRYHDFCLHTETTQVILPIPLTITPAFKTNIVSLSWKLHFEFVTTKADNLNPVIIPDSQGYMTKSAGHLDVQTMVWDLPLVILPNHPVTVARGLQLPACSTLIV